MAAESCKRLTPEELAQFPLFADDDRGALEWFLEQLEVRVYQSGDLIIKEGTPATEFIVVLEGEFHFRRPNDPYFPVIVRHAGQAPGVLPFSRMKVVRGRGTAVGNTRIGVMPAA